MKAIVLALCLMSSEAARLRQVDSPKANGAIAAIAAKLPAGFAIGAVDEDGNGSVTWKELYDALNKFKIPNLDTGVVKGLVTKFGKDGAKEGAGAGLDKAEFAKMVASFKKHSADALIPRDPNAFDTGCYEGDSTEGDEEITGDHGLSYRGLVTSTMSGRTCQKWLNDKPQKIPAAVKDAGDDAGIGNHNFCRNPDDSMAKPWCFTMDPTKEKEECDIPKCQGMERDYQAEADTLAKEVAGGLKCDCSMSLGGGSYTAKADKEEPIKSIKLVQEERVHIKAMRKRCGCDKKH